MELRRDKRFPLSHSTVVMSSTFGESEGFTINLSRQGCLVESSSRVNIGDVVDLRISVPGEASPIHVARGMVRWNLVGKIGVGFLTVEPSEQARLDRFLAGIDQGKYM